MCKATQTLRCPPPEMVIAGRRHVSSTEIANELAEYVPPASVAVAEMVKGTKRLVLIRVADTGRIAANRLNAAAIAPVDGPSRDHRGIGLGRGKTEGIGSVFVHG